MNLQFSPTGTLSTIPESLNFSWNIIPGYNAYYCVRLTDFSNGDISQLTHSPLIRDEIFGKGDNLDGGFNKNHLLTSPKLLPGRRYIWFTEILDSNVLEDISIAIFQQPQFLYT